MYSKNAKFIRRRKEQECEIAQLKAENDMIRKQAHRLKNIPLPQVPAKIGSLRNSNLSSQEGSFDEGLGLLHFFFPFDIIDISVDCMIIII